MAIGLMAVIICASGCQKENPAETKNIIPVVKSISTTTKASLSDDAEQLLFSAPVKSDAGEEYTLEAWISDTACEMPETKGTPVTSSNIQTAYGSFKTTAYCDGQIHDGINGATVNSQGNGKWEFADTHHWPKDKSKSLTFCSVAPSGTWTSNVSGLDWHGGEYATFTYTLPAPSGTGDAVSQQDLLIAIDAGQTQGTDGEAEINFHHALTSVKFTRGDIKDCTISSISLENFYDTGNATYNGGWTWTIPSGTAKKTYKQSFGTDVDDVSQATDANQSGGSLDPDTGESHTFMVIPQNLSSNNAKINITLDSGDTMTYDLSGSDNDAIKNWSTYAGKTVTFKVNKKPSCYDIILLVDCSRSMSQQYVFDIKNTSRGNYYWTPKEIIKNYKTYSNFISKFKGNSKVKFSLAYFNGATPYSNYGQTTGSKFKACKENSISLAGSSYIVFHLTNVTNSNFNDLKSYADDKISSCSYDYSAAFCGLQECYWELYHYGQSGSKKIIIVVSDGVPAAKSTSSGNDDLKFWTNDYTEATNAANLTIDATNTYSFTLHCTNESTKNPIITSTAKQIKDGYTYNGKTVQAEIYSILATAPSSSYKTENAINFMKAISSNCPNATSMSSMGTYNDNGYYYEIPSNGDLTGIFDTIYDQIME